MMLLWRSRQLNNAAGATNFSELYEAPAQPIYLDLCSELQAPLEDRPSHPQGA